MIKYLIAFAIFFSQLSNAEIVKSIKVIGNDRISLETIKVYGDIKLNNNYEKLEVDKILKKLYATDFFEEITISLQNGILNLNVKEYPSINNIFFEGEKTKKITKVLLEEIKLQKNNSFIKSYLIQDIGGIKKLYAQLGFNFVKIETKVENFSANRLNLTFIIDKGKKTKIAKIYFIGDKKVKDRRLRDIIVSTEDKFWKFLSKNTNLNKNNIDLDKRLLINYYKSIGFYDVQVVTTKAEVSETNDTTLTFNINAGTRYKINKISAKVNDTLDQNLFLSLEKDFKKNVGKYYSPFRIKKLLDEVDLLIDNNDLQFVEHNVKEIISGNGIEVEINIFEGSKQLVERINIKGNIITNEGVIRSELLLDEGDPFNELKLEKSIARLKARNIFGEVDKVVSQGSTKDQKIIDIKVAEKSTGEISAGAGIATAGGNFSFSVSENNWLGQGKRIETFLDVSKTSVKGALSVNDPNYKNSGNALSYNISSTKDDKPDSGYESGRLSLGIGTKFEQYKDVYLSPTLNLSHDDLKVLSTASASLKKQEGTYTDLSLGYSVKLDKRDRVFMPTDGFATSFSQLLPIYADTPYIQNAVSFSRYNSFSPNVVGAFKFFGSAINGLDDKDVRLSKRLNLNSNRLRGFESGKVGPKDGNDYVGGNYASAINLEANLPNLLPESTKTEVGIFLDAANLWGVDYSDTIEESNKIRSSFGINTSWLSPLGPMSVVLAQNITKAKTDTTETFNFRLGTTF
jgi:outer membrane protein insertion porin family|tara:strand:+ start:2216 stop:4441 length:2226 start_codon:yes stop_codon:yes gene_type:complete